MIEYIQLLIVSSIILTVSWKLFLKNAARLDAAETRVQRRPSVGPSRVLSLLIALSGVLVVSAVLELGLRVINP